MQQFLFLTRTAISVTSMSKRFLFYDISMPVLLSLKHGLLARINKTGCSQATVVCVGNFVSYPEATAVLPTT